MTVRAAYLIAAVVFALDRLTKWVIESRFGYLETVPVIPGFFDIVHAQNPGSAFSLFADSTSPFRTGILIAVAVAAMIVVSSMLRRAPSLDRPTALGLSLILGGAAGNVFDRARSGYVTDFLDFYVRDLHWPAFNVADSAIFCGAALLLIGMAVQKRQPAAT